LKSGDTPKLKILVSNQKGGVGKSSLSVNLAAYFAIERQMDTLLIDLDRQGTSSSWIKNAIQHDRLKYDHSSHLIQGGNRLGIFNVRCHVRDASALHDVVITDVTWSPAVGYELLEVFDLWIIPTSLSELELLSTIGLLRDLKPALDRPRSPKVLIVPNKIHPFQRKFDSMAAQRFPVPFLLTPPVTASKDFETLYLRDFVVSAAKDEVKARFLLFCEAVWQASRISLMEAQTIRPRSPSPVSSGVTAASALPAAAAPEILRVPDMIRAQTDAPV
jgi:cellulose biosynthesis protein BcsQ